MVTRKFTLLTFVFASCSCSWSVSPSIRALYTSENSTCVLLSDGAVKCWGMQLDGDGLHRVVTPTTQENLFLTEQLALGSYHTCAKALYPSAHCPMQQPCRYLGLVCWGLDGFNYGVIGDGLGQDQVLPTTVAWPDTRQSPEKIVAGASHTCALQSDQRVLCWGYNSDGQVGNGTTVNQLTPAFVNGLSNVLDISTGFNHSCGITPSSQVHCWGNNFSGQLGDGTRNNSSVPVTVNSSFPPLQTIVLGESLSCVLTQAPDHSLHCWGVGIAGVFSSLTPQRMDLPFRVQSFGLGSGHICVLSQDNAVYCWGENRFGQVGNGTTTDQRSPVQIFPAGSSRRLSVGYRHTCVQKLNGQLFCWGNNGEGQLGIETGMCSTIESSRCSSTPVRLW